MYTIGRRTHQNFLTITDESSEPMKLPTNRTTPVTKNDIASDVYISLQHKTTPTLANESVKTTASMKTDLDKPACTPYTVVSSILCDNRGRSVNAGCSYYVSGSTFTGDEMREICLSAANVQVDSSHSPVAYYPQGIDDTLSRDPLSGIISDPSCVLGARLALSSSEFFVYCPPIPDGWKVVAYRANMSIKDSGSDDPQLLSIRTGFYVRTIDNVRGGSTIKNYVKKLHNEPSSSNTWVKMDVAYIPGRTSVTADVGVIWLPVASTDDVFVGGGVRIVRAGTCEPVPI